MYINRSKNSKVTAIGHHQWLRLKSLNGKPTKGNKARCRSRLRG